MQHLKLDDLIGDAERVLTFDYFTFNGGEEHIRIQPSMVEEVIIEVSLNSSRKIMQLLMAANALRRLGYTKINLFAPYIPYGRQDRYCNHGEALSIKVMTAILNAQNFNKVWTLDNHSDVTSALLNHQRDIDLSAVIARAVPPMSGPIAIVSPDGGSLKRCYTVAKQLNIHTVVECSKKRNVATGEILETVVHDIPDHIRSYLVVDDICDGGKTFIELAKALRRKVTPSSLGLYVSHGIFSKGLEVFDGLYDRVYTTQSFQNKITNMMGTGFLLSDLLN